MTLLEVLLEKLSNINVAVKVNDKVIVVAPSDYYKVRKCNIVECCKYNKNSISKVTLYLDSNDYAIATNDDKPQFDLPILENYYIDEYYGRL